MAARKGGQRPDPQRWARFRRLLAYYLDCVEEDGRQEFVFEKTDSRTYATIDLPREWNLLQGADAERPTTLEARRLGVANQFRGEKVQLFYGYPVLTTWETLPEKSAPCCCYAPLFFQPIEPVHAPVHGQAALRHRLTADWPRPNRVAFQRLFGSSEEQNEVLEKLGLLDWSNDLQAVRIPEAVQRLLQLGVELPLQEPLDPNRLAEWSAVVDGQTSILNRAIIFRSTGSRYTAGLERELKALARAPDTQLDGTALAPIFAEGWQASGEQEPHLPVEVQPLNLEQRQAVAAAALAPLTIVTGPPGTGKSQVVLGALTNAFLARRPALFSSRNHKAVSVVEERANRLGEPPFMFRLGGQVGLGENLGRLLSSILGQGGRRGTEDDAGHLRAKYQLDVAAREDLERQLERVRVLRNEIDRSDRRLAAILEGLSREDAPVVCGGGKDGDSASFRGVAALLERHARGRKSGYLGLLWWRLRRTCELPWCRATLAKFAARYPTLGGPPSWGPDELEKLTAFAARAAAFAEANEHRRALNDLIAQLEELGSVDELAAEWGERCRAVWHTGRAILDNHRAYLGEGLSISQRAELGQVAAIARGLALLDPTDRAAWKLRKELGQLLPSVSGFLPTWAVTNLSAPGVLPDNAAMFDLAVIDEASQCDIPSAIPLLFRARRALIIGDPNQLRHITSIPPARERLLVAKHGLEAPPDQPFTFAANSLFDVAVASPCPVVVSLDDHFRSHADIVAFSNSHWYGDRLRVLTDYGALVLPDGAEPGLRWVQVAGSVTRPRDGGAVSEAEAAQVVQEVDAILRDGSFKGTIGVVTPFRAQANRIRSMMERAAARGALERVEFIADTAHGFQGDERDIIVFSPCVGAPMPPGALRFLGKTANLFNVAVTRARAQLRVVGNREACARSGVAHIEAFASHYAGLEARPTRQPDPSVGAFERPLAEALRGAGLPVLEQYVFGRYRLDLAVVDDTCRIGIEVDGEHFHKDLDGNRFKEDLVRDDYLRRRGWTVLRFWAVEVRDRLPQCVARVLTVRRERRARQDWTGGGVAST